ncbi:MAG: hypothetical protein A3K67_01315 [Euryarchaeota archaeon RBG_16_62_10]|nr:MAG: hypothetical protein A3K67_01315 [Euryarchaeota archaeon RBG_16_62_10]
MLALGVFAAPTIADKSVTKWTFAIYMYSDNDLDAWGELNNEWLMSVGSTADVNLVVLWDTSTGPAYLYKVVKGGMVEMTNFEYNGVETNMGDPAVLESFVDYLGSKFKADNLLVDLWDHGDDFRGICFDYDAPGVDGYDYLTHQEIGDALAGKDVDVIAADGCGIGIIEAAYEYVYRGVTAEWFVANENYVPLQGFPYDVIAADLVADPGMTPEELSADIVQRYAEMYKSGWLTELAAIKLSAVDNMVAELWDVTGMLSADMKLYKGLITSGRGHATMGWSQYGWEGFVDFPTIFEVVEAGLPAGSQLKAEAQELLDAIEVAVPYVGNAWPAEVWDPEGLSVFFPSADGSYKHNTWWRGSLYPTMQFAQDGWLDFLTAYYKG